MNPEELEAKHWFHLRLCCLRSSENCTVGVGSRCEWINQSQCSIPDLVIVWFFCFCFWLWRPSFCWMISNRVIKWKKKWKHSDPCASNSVELMTLLSIFTRSCKCSYNSNHNSDFVASEDNLKWYMYGSYWRKKKPLE